MNKQSLISLVLIFLTINVCFSMSNSLDSNLEKFNSHLQILDQSLAPSLTSLSILNIPFKSIFPQLNLPEYFPVTVFKFPSAISDEEIVKITAALKNTFPAKFVQLNSFIEEEKEQAGKPTYKIVSQPVLLDKDKNIITYETLINELTKEELLKKYIQPETLEKIIPQIDIKTGFSEQSNAQEALTKMPDFTKEAQSFSSITLQKDDGTEFPIDLE